MVKTEEEIAIMKEGGRILAGILKRLSEEAKPGITTWSLEEKARQMIKEVPIRKANRGSSISQSDIGTGVEPAFLGFQGYPAALCVSINEEVVHALPSERKIIPGDLVSLDLGIKYEGFNVDSAITVLAEPAIMEYNRTSIIPRTRYNRSDDVSLNLEKKLIQVTKECLNLGVLQAKIGNTLGDIGYAIQKHAEKNGFSIICDLVGHGIGRELHEEPEVPNFGKPGTGPKLKEGMVIAIEPMLSVGSGEVIENKKTLAWETKDKSLSAHFEHTVAITKTGPLVLT